MKYYYLDLFSGIGGFALGAHWAGMRFHGHYFSEVDDYAIGIYRKRFPDAVPLGDVRNIRGKELPKGRWFITGGFPCQDVSVAGKKAGLEGERSGLFSEYIRLIGEIRPAFAIVENVGNLAAWFDAGKGRYACMPSEVPMDGGEWSVEIEQYQGLAKCVGSLSEIGYDAEWAVIRASDVGAPHLRSRFWIVGYPSGGGRGGITRRRTRAEPPDGYSQMEIWAGWNSNGGEALADTGYKGFYEQGITENTCGYSGQSGGIFRDGLQGGQEESGILADSDVLNDDNSGHGTSPVFRERSPEAEIPGSDPDADRQRRQEFIDKITAWAKDPDSPSCRNGIGNFWAVEPNVGRVANGIPSRVDQLKCLGNAVVPQIPQLICEGLKDDFYDGRPEDYGEAWHDANNQ